MNTIFLVICSLILTVQHSILAQDKPKQESKLTMQKTKEIKPGKGDQTEHGSRAKDDIKSKETQVSGMELYRAIIQNNLFMPLGSGAEAKREEFVLTGTMGKSAIIQMAGSGQSFYVSEGQSFGNNVNLVRVGEDSVTIIHEGNRKELELTSGVSAGQAGGPKGGITGQRQGNFGKGGEKMETANRIEKKPGSGVQKEGWTGGEKKGRENDWARNMSIDELRDARGKIAEHIEGLRRKGVTDPKEYQGAMQKMETVDRAIAEKEGF